MEKEVIQCFDIKTRNIDRIKCVYKAVFKLMFSWMAKTNAETGKKKYSFWVADVKNIFTMRSYIV